MQRAALALAALMAVGCYSCAQKGADMKSQAAPAALSHDTVTAASGLKYIVTQAGTGSSPAKGARIQAHYTGYFLDGRKFDSSVDRGRPFEFQVGAGMVIPGWDEAFLTMKKGEKRRLIIPPHLGYGEQGAGPIPPNTTLVFDVELIGF